MDLVKSWLGQALRATGAAIVVPAAVLVALSLTALGGAGLGDVGSLSQIVSGPRVAGSEVRVDDGGSEIADAVTQLAAADNRAALAAPSPGPGGAPGPVGGGQPPGATGPGGGGAPVGGVTPPGNGDGDGGGGGGGGGGGDDDGGPVPPEPPPPSVVEGVGNTVKDVTAGTPVAPTVEDAVDGLVETCGRLGCP